MSNNNRTTNAVFDESEIESVANTIKAHEEMKKHPYLDTKGNVTIAGGHLVPNKERFVALDLTVKDEDGTVRPATVEEKKSAYDQMQAKKQSLNGDYNQVADSYKDVTKVRMGAPAMKGLLKNDIQTRARSIVNEVGQAVWDGLTMKGKTAMVNLSFATSNRGLSHVFPSMIKAVKAGDLVAAALETPYYIDPQTGKRPEERRLLENFMAYLDLDKTVAKEFLDRALALSSQIRTREWWADWTYLTEDLRRANEAAIERSRKLDRAYAFEDSRATNQERQAEMQRQAEMKRQAAIETEKFARVQAIEKRRAERLERQEEKERMARLAREQAALISETESETPPENRFGKGGVGGGRKSLGLSKPPTPVVDKVYAARKRSGDIDPWTEQPSASSVSPPPPPPPMSPAEERKRDPRAGEAEAKAAMGDPNRGGPGMGGSYGGDGDAFDPSGRFHGGGLVTEGDPDDGVPVAALVQEGEFLFPKAAVDAIGADVLQALNGLEPERAAAVRELIGRAVPRDDEQTLRRLMDSRAYLDPWSVERDDTRARVKRGFELIYPGGFDPASGGVIADHDPETRLDDLPAVLGEGSFVLSRRALALLGEDGAGALNTAARLGESGAVARLRRGLESLLERRFSGIGDGIGDGFKNLFGDNGLRDSTVKATDSVAATKEIRPNLLEDTLKPAEPVFRDKLLRPEEVGGPRFATPPEPKPVRTISAHNAFGAGRTDRGFAKGTARPSRANLLADPPTVAAPKRTAPPTLSNESLSSNRRLADSLAKTSDFTGIKRHIKPGLEKADPLAVAETQDLIAQMNKASPGHGDKLAKELGLDISKISGTNSIAPSLGNEQRMVKGSDLKVADDTPKANLDGNSSLQLPQSEPLGQPKKTMKDIDSVIEEMSKQWPDAKIRITGKGRTVRRQAELMAKRRLRDRKDFMGTYTNRPHIREMDKWVGANPNATEKQAIRKFESIIRKAKSKGYQVSKHLSDDARDISIPKKDRAAIRKYLENNGIRVLDEGSAATGRHWHLDY